MKIPSFLKSILFGVPIGITVVDSVGYVARVDGISMQPALNPDRNTTDYVFLNRLAVKSFEVQRGDIVSLISPKDPSQKIIKRVVGIQGDIIVTLGYKDHVIRVPEGHCWIEGDHTGHSMDSNNFGPVSLGLVTAKASCIVWPPSRWQIIPTFLPDSRKPLNLRSISNQRIYLKMRAISLVKRIEFEFTGNVARNALTLGDVDNDGASELIIGNDLGEVAIFKSREKIQTITNLSFITCIAVGDVRNENKNSLVIVTADGWCYIYETPIQKKDNSFNSDNVDDELKIDLDELDGQIQSSSNAATSTSNTETHSSSESTGTEKLKSTISKDSKLLLTCVHTQRIPANVKNIILGDVDGDGLIEMVLGLTDRVVRSYRWCSEPDKSVSFLEETTLTEDKLLGKFIALNKWECANQIGSITLHHTWCGTPSILVAQPGGTFMRIKCFATEEQDSDNKLSKSDSSIGESFPGSIDYQSLGISRMRNQNISTEILGDLRCSNVAADNLNIENSGDSGKIITKGRPYAVATLDGTIMLVQDEIILWAIAVDHQVFALTKLDITGNGSDDIIVCSWDGQTYILDQNKNSVRFHLEEPVRAFHSGWYNLNENEPPVTALVYVTFKNTVIIYYDIPLRDLICTKFEPDLEKLSELFISKDRNQEEALEYVKNMDKKTRRDLIEYLLYNVRC